MIYSDYNKKRLMLLLPILLLFSNLYSQEVGEKSIDNYSIIELESIENTTTLNKDMKLLLYENMATQYLDLESFNNAFIYFAKGEEIKNPNYGSYLEKKYLSKHSSFNLDASIVADDNEILNEVKRDIFMITHTDVLTNKISNLNEAYRIIELLAYKNDYVEMKLTSNSENQIAYYRMFTQRFRGNDSWIPVTLDTTIKVLRRAYQLKYENNDGDERILKMPCPNGCSFKID